MQSEGVGHSNKISLLPISLPVGVSPEEIAKLVFSVLYRRAAVETDRWAHWVLLATLQILESNTAPPLDISSLCKLRGLSEKDPFAKSYGHDWKNTVDDIRKVHSGDIEDDIKKCHVSGHENHSKKRYRSGSKGNNKKRHKSGSEDDKKCHRSGSEDNSRTDKTLRCKIERNDYSEHETKDPSKKRRHSGTSDKETTPRKGNYSSVDIKKGETCIVTKAVTNEKKHNSHIVEKRLSANADTQTRILKRNIDGQVSSRAPSIVHNKWTQVWIKKPVHKSSMTEVSCQQSRDSVQDVKSKPDSTASDDKWTSLKQKETTDQGSQAAIHCSDKESQASIHCSDKESQTIIVCYRHASCQATPWKLIPFYGLPKRRRLDSSSANSEGDLMLMFDTGKNIRNGDVSVISSKMGMGSDKVDMEQDERKGNLMKKMEIFHGRLLITSKSKIEAPIIPGSPVESSLLFDPRCSEECHVNGSEKI